MYGSKTYAPLFCQSHFSFLEGASHPEELVEEAHRLGLQHIAVTDRDGVYGMVRAHTKAKDLGIHLICGARITCTDNTRLVLLCRNAAGWANLCRIITAGRLAHPKGECCIPRGAICSRADGLIALWGGPDPAFPIDHTAANAALADLHAAFGTNLYALITRHLLADERRNEAAQISLARTRGIPLVAAVQVLYHSCARRPLQDVLTCIRHHVTLATAGTVLRPNDEYHLKPAAAFSALFADLPQAVAQTIEIAAQCTFGLDDIHYFYPSEYRPDGTSSFEWLKHLTIEGAHKRYGAYIPPRVTEQLNKELALIDELDYPGYFLTMSEIVRYCNERGILCQGRGSAANSAVCYCLGITAIDPVRMDLLFERFISRERAEPPDIDLDIEHNRREEVIQHVYEKYGRGHAAMVAVFIRYRPKSAVRDVGKVLGIPERDLERLAPLVSRYGHLDPSALTQAGFDTGIPAHAQLLELAGQILDFPRHLSIHPGGFILGQAPIAELVPVENATMPGRTVIQWDKEDVEALGLFKVDLLALGALTHLTGCFSLLARRDIHLSMAAIPADDQATYDMIGRGDTVGVFQIESRAQMSMLPRLKPRTFYDLVIEISIVRPGPITGGMVHPYLRRRRGEEPVVFPHPSLEAVLGKTLGVPLFQEQVMKVAMVAADYTPGEADQLRRDMAAWRQSGRIERHHDRLVNRMTAKGIEPAFAERVFEQIRGFGEYGFPESHAASFALISYASAWLRCHYPAEFTCALLNALPMGFYTPATIVEDAKRNGVVVRPIDVCVSQFACIMEGPHTLRIGLRFIDGLGEEDSQRIVRAREQAPFVDIDDFARRTRLARNHFDQLSQAGAFASLCADRREALWTARGASRTVHDTLSLKGSENSAAHFAPLNDFEKITWDYAASGHSTAGHPLSPLREELAWYGILDARELQSVTDGDRVHYAGLVISRQRPSTAAGVVFMTLEDETGFANLVIWKDLFEAQKVLAKTSLFLGVTGKIQRKDNVTHLIAENLWEPRLSSSPAASPSRDFK